MKPVDQPRGMSQEQCEEAARLREEFKEKCRRICANCGQKWGDHLDDDCLDANGKSIGTFKETR